MPFGLKKCWSHIPEVGQPNVLSLNKRNVEVYIDDMLVKSKVEAYIDEMLVKSKAEA